jgi:hypothetical protein
MGCQSQPNQGLLIGTIVHLLELINEDAKEAERLGDSAGTNELWKVRAYLCAHCHLTARP